MASARPSPEALLPPLREVLARDGRLRWPLRGDSMRPTLPSMCEIEIVPLPSRLSPGDLVVFASGIALVAHRLVRRSGSLWIAQGDGRLGPDLPISREHFLGLVGAAYAADGTPCWPGRHPGIEARFWVARHHALRPLRGLWRAARAARRTRQ